VKIETIAMADTEAKAVVIDGQVLRRATEIFAARGREEHE
jgi:hypothetical protein